MDGWVVIVSALLLVARAEDAACARARAHRSSAHQEKMKDLEKFQRKKETRRSISSSDDVISGHASFGQWAEPINTSQRSLTKPSVFGVSFLKCAQVDTGSGIAQVRVTLVVRNPEEGHDLSQLRIRDSVSDVTLLQTNGSLQERGYQTFSTDTLPAGSQYVVFYRMNVESNRKQILTLPAFLTFSNGTQSDIHPFGPVVANLTLRISITEQDDVGLSLPLLGFMCSFLLSLLLSSLCVVGVKLQRRRQHTHAHTSSSGREEAGPSERDVTAAANQEAAFEDTFVDILMLEDPENMMQALDSLQVSALSRAAVALERVRVQGFEGLVSALLAGGGAERRVLGVVRGQLVGMEGKLQEDHASRMAALAARCNRETRERMEAQQQTHASEAARAQRLLQHAPQQQQDDVRAQLDELHQQERRRLRERLRLKHEHASAHAHREQSLRRRFELHKILGEELEEAERTGELEKHTANRILLQYYSCQDALEEGLDVLLANQRALLAERHAQRRFLAQSLQSLHAVTSETFSGAHGESPDVQLEILRVKQSLEETVCRERSTIRCDIIKRRRQLLSEKVCEHWRQLQVCVSGSSDVTVNQFLQKWTELLMIQNNQLSELLNHLDEEAAARTRKVGVCALQSALAQLRAAGVQTQTQAVQESLQRMGRAAARQLRSAQSRVRQQQRQELRDQTRVRDAFREFSSALCVCQRSLSHEQRLRLQLECVKAACRLDRCLVLHHTVCELERLGTDARDPAVTPAASEVEVTEPRSSEVTESRSTEVAEPRSSEVAESRSTEVAEPRSTEVTESRSTEVAEPRSSEVTESRSTEVAEPRSSEVAELQCFRRRLQERLRSQRSDTQTVFQEEQLRVCEECVAVFVALLHWEQAEKRIRVAETHTALLKLQTLITAETHTTCDLTHTIHTHRLALEEAELQLQRGEVRWAESAEGRGFCSEDEEDEEDLFTVNADSGVSVLLQEALFKRQQLQRLTDRKRNQTLEQLNRLQTYCEQDLAFTAALVKQSLITVPDLHNVLRLLLPTVPEGELLSLMDALGPGSGGASGGCASLADGLRLHVVSRNLSHSPQHRDRERERFVKKRQKLLDKLLSGAGGSEDIRETARKRRRIRNRPAPEPSSLQPAEEAGPGRVTRDGDEGAWPVGVAQYGPVSMADGNEGVWPVGVASERLFVFRCVPPSAQQETQTTRSRKKKRNFLNFKRASVAPQEHA